MGVCMNYKVTSAWIGLLRLRDGDEDEEEEEEEERIIDEYAQKCGRNWI